MKLGILSLAATLVLASSAMAQRPYADDELGRHGSRYSTPMPEMHEMDELLERSRRLDDAMEKIEKNARKRGRDTGLSRLESDALRRVQHLAARADRFEDTLERNPDRPDLSVRDFEGLLGSYLLVDESFRTLYRSGLIGEDFRRVQSVMDDLVTYYDGYPVRGTREYERLLYLAELQDEEDFGEADVEFGPNEVDSHAEIAQRLGENRDDVLIHGTSLRPYADVRGGASFVD